MSKTNLSVHARRVALAGVLGAGALVALPAGANAAVPANCDASALQLSVLGAATIDPIHANGGGAVCANSDGTLLSLPLLIADVQAVQATTRVTPNVQATSNARVAGAKVGVAGPVVDALTGPLLTGPNNIVGQVDGLVNGLLGPLNGVLAPLNGVLGGLIPGGIDNGALLTGLTQNLTGALTAALPNVLDAGVIQSTAQATCSNGVPRLSGSSQITDLKVLGSTIDPNDAANRVLSLDTAHLNLGQVLSVNDILRGVKLQTTGVLGTTLSLLIGSSNTTLYQIVNGPGGLLGLVDNALTTAGLPSISSIVATLTNTVIQPALDTLQINLPTGLLHAVVTPNRQTIAGDALTQETLALSVTALNQPILDGVLARSHVSAGSPGCVPPVVNPPKKDDEGRQGVKNPDKYTSPEAEAILQCSKLPATLIDVYGTGGRTYVQGVAEKRLVGKSAAIYLTYGKKKVGTTKVGKDGLFSTKVALPPAKIRGTSKARYYAVVGGRKTQALKFSRRMETTGLSATSTKVTLKGRVVAPLASKQKTILIRQRLTCKTYKTVARITPDSKGRFSATVDAPAKIGAAVYRAQTQVIKSRRSAKLYPTFTLPRVVGLK